MTIGARLKEERERLHLTQTAMAEEADTTKKTQIDYETDRTPPKATYLAAIAKLGVDVAYVLTGMPAAGRLNVPVTPREMKLIDSFRMSGPQVQAAVESLLGATATQPPPAPPPSKSKAGTTQNFHAPVSQVAGTKIVNKFNK